MRDLLSFNRMITPGFIHVIYWTGIVVVLLTGLGMIAGGGIIKGLLAIVIGLIIARVGCEVLIVLFHINDHLAAIRAGKNI